MQEYVLNMLLAEEIFHLLREFGDLPEGVSKEDIEKLVPDFMSKIHELARGGSSREQ